MKEEFKAYRPALFFILRFVGLYLITNTLYGLYVNNALPGADMVTKVVASQTAWILSQVHEPVQASATPTSAYVSLTNASGQGVSVYEGCNGVNVFLVYLSFLVAYAGPRRLWLRFAAIGLVLIHLINLSRVSLLFEVAIYFPDQLYLFHKYLFTAIIYTLVFVLWYWWVNAVKKIQHDAG